MKALDYILDGLERALALERELGVKVVECDRSLLKCPAKAQATPPPPRPEPPPASVRPPVAAAGAEPSSAAATPVQYDFIFLHDRPLSPKGVEMMAKIISAMKRDAESAPVIVAPPLPKAKISVVLGGNALKKYFPGLRAAPGQWLKAEDGRDVLVTNSPEYILRFGEVTPAVEKIKKDMWRSLKTVMQRLNV